MAAPNHPPPGFKPNGNGFSFSPNPNMGFAFNFTPKEEQEELENSTTLQEGGECTLSIELTLFYRDARIVNYSGDKKVIITDFDLNQYEEEFVDHIHIQIKPFDGYVGIVKQFMLDVKDYVLQKMEHPEKNTKTSLLYTQILKTHDMSLQVEIGPYERCIFVVQEK